MSTELTLLAWCLVLAVVQVLMPSILRIQETGPEYNASPRDVPSPKPEAGGAHERRCTQPLIPQC